MPSIPKVFLPEVLTPTSEIDLRALAEMQDETETFLTIYISTIARDQQLFASSRLKAMEKALPIDQKESFSKTLELVEPALSASPLNGEKGRVIFASAAHELLRAYRLTVDLQPLLAWDRSPFLLPMASLRENYGDYWLLLIDSREARLYLVMSDLVVERDRATIDLMNKHKKGGWSQMRFNRLRKGAISSFFSQVADDLAELEDQQQTKGLVVAGPGKAKTQFVELLPLSLKEKLLGSIDASMEIQPSELAKIGDELARNDEQERSRTLAETLKDNILKGQPAAYGPIDVRKALEEGRVNYLLISDGFALPKMICMSCHHEHEKGERCPTCGGEMAALRLEEMYDMAERTGAEVVLVEEDEFLQSMGHVGAILRY
jgi:peptide chain release factor subunit 1